jgi:hypothetical protein
MSCPMPVIPDAARTAVSVTRSDTRTEAPVAVFATEGGIQVFVPSEYPRSASSYTESHATTTGIILGGATAWFNVNDFSLYTAGLIAGLTSGLRNTVEHLQQPSGSPIPAELQGLTAAALRTLRSRQDEDMEAWANRLIQSVDRPDDRP